MGKVSAERVLELTKAHLRFLTSEDAGICGYTEDENKVIREFVQTLLEDIESYENGYEDGKCSHLESKTENIPGTDETLTYCTHCGIEL